MRNKKILLRILLSPFIFLYGVLMLLVLTIFPLSFIIPISFVCFVLTPIIWVLRESGSEIKYPEPFIRYPYETLFEFKVNCNNSVLLYMRNHFLGIIIHIWVVFAFLYRYIKTGKISISGEW